MWSLAASVKDLAEEQVRMTWILKKELKSLWVASQGQEDALWDMGGEVGNCAVMLELFMRGERFLRIQEMGLLEGGGHEVWVRHRKSKEVGIAGFDLEDKGKGKEKEVESEDDDETMS